jgi:hypothetical protein
MVHIFYMFFMGDPLNGLQTCGDSIPQGDHLFEGQVGVSYDPHGSDLMVEGPRSKTTMLSAILSLWSGYETLL